jgi:flagellar basal-body rod protein FlgB
MGWMEGLVSGGAVPALETSISFAAARHRLIADNLANADTPGYRRKDLDVRAFNDALKEACGADACSSPEKAWPLARRAGAEGGILRHDGNDVNMEMELALLSKNASFHNQMVALLRKSLEAVKMAISERPGA